MYRNLTDHVDDWQTGKQCLRISAASITNVSRYRKPALTETQ
jgi:hypothetical protein